MIIDSDHCELKFVFTGVPGVLLALLKSEDVVVTGVAIAGKIELGSL